MMYTTSTKLSIGTNLGASMDLLGTELALRPEKESLMLEVQAEVLKHDKFRNLHI